VVVVVAVVVSDKYVLKNLENNETQKSDD
jgi:hypothetical protein